MRGFNFLKSILFVEMTILAVSPCWPATTSSLSSDTAWRAAQETFQAYEQSADVQTDTAQWKHFLETGIEAALGRWESEATRLMQDGQVPVESADEVRKDFERQVDVAFGSRLADDWAKAQRGSVLDQASFALEATIRSLVFQTDADGHVLLDANGNPLKNTSASQTEFTVAIDALKAQAEMGWSQGNGAIDAELAVSSDAVRASYSVARQDRVHSLEAQWSALSDRELARFTSVRDSDQASMRAKSDSQFADVLAAQLAAGVTAGTSQGIQNLQGGLSTVAGAKPDDVSSLAQSWQDDFQQQIQTGLDGWHQAEQTLLQSRMTWENQAQTDLQTGESAWQVAYTKLEQGRQSWESQMQALIAQASSQWDTKQSQLQQAVAGAQAQWQSAIQDREGLMSNQIGAEIDLVAQDSQMVQAAQQSAATWLGSSFWNQPVVTLGSSQMWDLVGTKFSGLIESKASMQESTLQTAADNDVTRVDQVNRSLAIYANASAIEVGQSEDFFQTYANPDNAASYTQNSWMLMEGDNPGSSSNHYALVHDDSGSIGGVLRRLGPLADILSNPTSFSIPGFFENRNSSGQINNYGATFSGVSYHESNVDALRRDIVLAAGPLFSVANAQLNFYGQYSSKLITDRTVAQADLPEIQRQLLVTLIASQIAQNVLSDPQNGLSARAQAAFAAGEADPLATALSALDRPSVFASTTVNVNAILNSSGLKDTTKEALLSLWNAQSGSILTQAQSSAFTDHFEKYKKEFTLDDGAGELSYWAVLQKQYQASLATHEALLASTYGVAWSDTPGGTTNAYTDDLSREVLKAQSVQTYWDKEYQVASAVAQYAKNQNSTRETDTTTQTNLDAALAQYDVQKTTYDQAVTALTNADSTLKTQTGLLDQAKAQLEQLSAAVQAAKDDYQSLMDQVTANNGAFFVQQIHSDYQSWQQALGVSGGLTQAQRSEQAYQMASNTFDNANRESTAAQTLKILVQGRAATPSTQAVISLDAFKATRDAADAVDDKSSWDKNNLSVPLAALGVRPSSVAYSVGSSLYTEWASSTAVEQKTITGAKLDLWIAQQKNLVQESYQEREDEIRLLTTDDVMAWYTSVTGAPPTSLDDVNDKLLQTAQNANWLTTQALAQRETQLWACVETLLSQGGPLPLTLGPWTTTADTQRNLARIWLFQNSGKNVADLVTTATEHLDQSQALATALAVPGDWAAAQQLALAGGYALQLMNGSGALGVTWTGLETADVQASMKRSQALEQTWSSDQWQAPALVAWTTGRTLAQLCHTLQNKGLFTVSGTLSASDMMTQHSSEWISWSTPESLAAVHGGVTSLGWTSKDDAVRWAADIMKSISDCGAELPSYLLSAVDTQLSAIVQLVDLTLGGSSLATTQQKSANDRQTEAQKNMTSLSAVQGFLMASDVGVQMAGWISWDQLESGQNAVVHAHLVQLAGEVIAQNAARDEAARGVAVGTSGADWMTAWANWIATLDPALVQSWLKIDNGLQDQIQASANTDLTAMQQRISGTGSDGSAAGDERVTYAAWSAFDASARTSGSPDGLEAWQTFGQRLASMDPLLVDLSSLAGLSPTVRTAALRAVALGLLSQRIPLSETTDATSLDNAVTAVLSTLASPLAQVGFEVPADLASWLQQYAHDPSWKIDAVDEGWGKSWYLKSAFNHGAVVSAYTNGSADWQVDLANFVAAQKAAQLPGALQAPLDEFDRATGGQTAGTVVTQSASWEGSDSASFALMSVSSLRNEMSSAQSTYQQAHYESKYWGAVAEQDEASKKANWRDFLTKGWQGEDITPTVADTAWSSWADTSTAVVVDPKSDTVNWQIDVDNKALIATSQLSDAWNQALASPLALNGSAWASSWSGLSIGDLTSSQFAASGNFVWNQWSSTGAQTALADAQAKAQSDANTPQNLEVTIAGLGSNYINYLAIKSDSSSQATSLAQRRVTDAKTALEAARIDYETQLRVVQSADSALSAANDVASVEMTSLDNSRTFVRVTQAIRDWAVGSTQSVADAQKQSDTVQAQAARAAQVVQALQSVQTSLSLSGTTGYANYDAALNTWKAAVQDTSLLATVQGVLALAQSSQQKAVTNDKSAADMAQAELIGNLGPVTKVTGIEAYVHLSDGVWSVSSSADNSSTQASLLTQYFSDSENGVSEFDQDLYTASKWLAGLSSADQAATLQSWGLAMAYQAQQINGGLPANPNGEGSPDAWVLGFRNTWLTPIGLRQAATDRLSGTDISQAKQATWVQAEAAYNKAQNAGGAAVQAFQFFEAMTFLGLDHHSAKANASSGVFAGSWNVAYLQNAQNTLQADENHQYSSYQMQWFDLFQRAQDYHDYTLAKSGRESTQDEKSAIQKILDPDVQSFASNVVAFASKWGEYSTAKVTLAHWTGASSTASTPSVSTINEALQSVVSVNGGNWSAVFGATQAQVDAVLNQFLGSSPSTSTAASVGAEILAAQNIEALAAVDLDGVNQTLASNQSDLIAQADQGLALFVRDGGSLDVGSLIRNSLSREWNQSVADKQKVDFLISLASSSSLSESARQVLFKDVGNWINRLYADRMARSLDVQNDAWTQTANDLAGQRSDWQAQMNQLLTDGRAQWQSSSQQLQSAEQAWIAQFAGQYQAKDTIWTAAYERLETSKTDWVNKAAQMVSQQGGVELLQNLGLDEGEALRLAQIVMVDPINSAANAKSAIGSLSVSPTLAAILAEVQAQGKTVSRMGAEVSSVLGLGGISISTISSEILADQNRDTDAVQMHLARVSLEVAHENLLKAADGLSKQVDARNQSTDASVAQTLAGAGYQQQGLVWDRLAVVDSTIGGEIREHQKVDTYQYYIMPALDVSFDFGGLDAAGASSLGAMAEVSTEIDKLKGDMIEILGDDSGKKGKMGTWIGDAPSSEGAGSGQLGKIFGEFQVNMGKESQGLAALAKPTYDQKLWDDRGSPFKAFSIKSLENIYVSSMAAIVACVPGIGTALSVGINLANSAAWTAADVANGQESWQDGWSSWAKGGAVSVATAFIPGAGAGLTQAMGVTGSVGQSVVTAGINAIQNKMISSTVNAVDFDGGVGFSWDRVGAAWDPTNAANYADIASAMVTAGVSTGLNDTGRGFLGDKWADYQKVGKMAGSLAGTAVTYGMTGSASLNVLNLGDFLDPFGTNATNNSYMGARSGLMQVNFGSEGWNLGLGRGGTDVSGSVLYGVTQGLGVYTQNVEISAQAQKMQEAGLKENLSVGLRSIGSSIDAKDAELYKSIMSGQTTVVDNSNLSAMAQTVDTGNGTKRIELGKQKLGGEFDMSVLLAHEAVRDGKWDGTHGQQNETNEAVINHMKMAQQIVGNYGSAGLSLNLASEAEVLMNAQKAMANDPKMTGEDKQKALDALGAALGGYDSSADYWKLTKDGKLQYDGKANLYDESGNLIRETNSQGVEGSMLELMGLPDTPTNRTEVHDMMKSSGMQMGTNGMWVGSNETVLEKLPFGINGGSYAQDHVNLTDANMGKTISLDQVNEFFTSVGATKATYQNFIEKNYGSASAYLTTTVADNSTGQRAIYRSAYSVAEMGMIDYNMNHDYNAQSFLPGSTVSTRIGDSVTQGNFMELHPGSDIVAGKSDDVISAGYYSLVAKDYNADGTAAGVVLSRFGTDKHTLLYHFDPAAVDSLLLGKVFSPGQKILNYPDQVYGTSNGIHIHETETAVFNGVRSFVNPDSHEKWTGTWPWLSYDKGIQKLQYNAW